MNIFKKEKDMWEKLLGTFSGLNFSTATKAMQNVAPIVEDLEKNYLQDKELKNAMIDTMIDILKAHKD